MKFIRAKYSNYRCFKDVEVFFDTDLEKNISLVIAPNGGGKTEMLFSFWWVLYGFEFSDLKGKEPTPYSLNSSLYNEVSNGLSKSATSLVELEFESDGITYTMRRSETFSLNRNRLIKKEMSVEFFNINPNGTCSTPIRDVDQVRNQLSRIIPKSILYGIVFDGERMKQLSSVDDNSKMAIEGVIKQITNEELFNLCVGELNEIQKSNTRQKKQIAKNEGNTTLENVLHELQMARDQVQMDSVKLQGKKDRYEIVVSDFDRISRELRQHQETKTLETTRSRLKKELENKNKDLDSYVEDFYKNLSDGYVLVCKKLFSDVRLSLEKFDIPVGLTVEAVKSIMQRDYCICGHPINDAERARMELLLKTLPPDNINSTIHEMVRQTELAQATQRRLLDQSYDKIDGIESEISNIKKDIARISTQISANAPEEIQTLEKLYSDLVIERDHLNHEIDQLNSSIETNNQSINRLLKVANSLDKINAAYKVLDAKDRFIQKCLDAFKKIDDFNKRQSLKLINEKLDEAYRLLSEDYSRGRRICIGQYSADLKNRILSYYVTDYRQSYERMESDGTINALTAQGMSQDEINERIIAQIRTSSSTGQSKINTLAFAKAILDYSNAERDDNSTEVSREYPFLIDSPFTELANENLEHSADSIHLFSHQIILLISEESFNRTKSKISPYVKSMVSLVKEEGESYSFVSK